MMTDRILAALALLGLLAFLSILVIWVKRWDLTIVVGVSVAFTIYDFYRELWPASGSRA